MPAVSSSAHDPRRALTGVGFKLTSVLCLMAMAASVKALGGAVPPGQVVFFRGLVSMVVIAGMAWHMGGFRLLTTRNWRAHAARSLAGSLSMFCWFVSLTMIPLAEMSAISFTVPLFITLLALLFLGERIHAYRWTALAVGFAGVLVIFGPDLAELWRRARGPGLLVDPIDGDWQTLDAAAARRIARSGIRVVYGAEAAAALRQFLRDALK